MALIQGATFLSLTVFFRGIIPVVSYYYGTVDPSLGIAWRQRELRIHRVTLSTVAAKMMLMLGWDW